jgi:hypothetical protein
MNMLATLALTALSAVTVATPVAAFKFAPPSTSFAATGPVTIRAPSGASYQCTLSIRGRTTSVGKAKITTVVFTPGAAACGNTVAMVLPWRAAAKKATTARIANLGFFTPFGFCGPAGIQVKVSNTGLWTIPNAALLLRCLFGASLPTSPPIVIVP